MFVGHPRQYDDQGRLLGKCEHCGHLVSLDHFDSVPTNELNTRGETIMAALPKCQPDLSGVTDRQFNRSTDNSSLYA